ncbi:MAG: Calx-beta domain-containing protein [Desulfamplus sp.]
MANTNHHLKLLIIIISITCFTQTAFSSFTKLDSSGQPLLENARDWAMVEDSKTGLIWEVKTTIDEVTNYNDPNDPDNIYTWYNSNLSTNGGYAGIDNDNPNTEDFINAMNSKQFGTFRDWRMPTKDELLTIVRYDVGNPAIDTVYFKNTKSDYYWTGTTVSDYPEQAWKVGFYDGYEGYHEKSEGYYCVRAVRSGNIQPTQKPGVISFVQPAYEVNEADGKVTVALSRTGGSDGTVSVNYALHSTESTAAENNDFIFQSRVHTLTWEDGDSSNKTFDITINDDDNIENNETIILELLNPTEGAALGNLYISTITIIDNDTNPPAHGVIQFITPAYEVNEADGKITVTVNRTGGSDGAVSVNYALHSTESTAADGSDFTLPSDNNYTLTWEDGDSSNKTFDITINDDDNIENNETIILELLNPTEGAALGNLYISTITIIDNDTNPPAHGVIQFITPAYEVNEADGKVTVALSRTGGSDGAVSVNYALHSTESTAVDGSDFTLPSDNNYTLTWEDGDSSNKTFDITINDDDNIESDETIVLELLNPTEGAALGNLYISTIIIIDNDTTPPAHGVIQFITPAYEVNEADGKVTVALSRTGGSDGTVSVNYALHSTESTASENDDFAFQSRVHTLTWEDGDNSNKTFDITINDDNNIENNEIIVLELLNPTEGAALGNLYISTITIIDNDTTPLTHGIIQFITPAYEVNEADGKITVALSRTGGSDGTVSVNYALHSTESTAADGSDFTLPSDNNYTLTWEDGDSSNKTFDITINNDDNIESDETIVLELLNPTEGAALGNLYINTTTIIDNDTLPNVEDITDKSDDINDIENSEGFESISDEVVDDIQVLDNNMPQYPNEPPSEKLVNAINITIQNIGDIIDISLYLLQKDKIDLDQALKPLELLEDIIDLGAKTAKAGGAISIESVTKSIGSVEAVVDETISNNVAAEKMRNSSDSINSIIDNMPDIMNAALRTDDVLKILGSIQDEADTGIKSLTGAGIKASLKGGSNPSQTVDKIGSIVAKGLEKAIDGKIVNNTGNIIKSAGGIINYSVDVLQNNTDNVTTIQNTLQQLQIEINLMLDKTTENIKNKPIIISNEKSITKDNKSLYGTDKSDNSTSIIDFRYLMSNVSGLTTPIIKAKSILDSNLISTMRELSRETMKNILTSFPAFISSGNRASIFEKDDDTQKFLTDHPQLLNDLIAIASVNLTPGMVMTSDEIKEILKKNSLFNESEINFLANGLPELPNFNHDIIKSGSTTFALIDLLRTQIKSHLPAGTTVSIRDNKGIQLMIILKNISLGLDIPLYVQDARVVADSIPDGFYGMPEGVFIFVSNGIAGVITPVPKDSMDILLSVYALFASGKEQPAIKVNTSGGLNLQFKNRFKFSSSFSYGTVKKRERSFDAGRSSFELHGTDPASEAYSVLVVYDDDTTQQLSPSISALEQLVQVLDQLAAGSYTIDKSTGIATVLGIRFKPSYLIEPATTESENNWFQNNKSDYGIPNFNGIAWESDDYNGDGALDLKMWTLESEQFDGKWVDMVYKQIIYTVIQ